MMRPTTVTIAMLSTIICVLLLATIPFTTAQSANPCSFSSLKAQGLSASLIVSQPA